MAAPFDEDRLVLKGTPVPVAEQLSWKKFVRTKGID
jgi:hypothetical protein